jgi:hypothetical protein
MPKSPLLVGIARYQLGRQWWDEVARPQSHSCIRTSEARQRHHETDRHLASPEWLVASVAGGREIQRYR